MAKRKTIAPAKVCCKDCRHERPVLHEFLAHDGSAVFATCDYQPYYRQRRWPLECRNYEPKEAGI